MAKVIYNVRVCRAQDPPEEPAPGVQVRWMLSYKQGTARNISQCKVTLLPGAHWDGQRYENCETALCVLNGAIDCQIETRSPMPMAEDEDVWIPRNHSHTLTNTGDSPARFFLTFSVSTPHARSGIRQGRP